MRGAGGGFLRRNDPAADRWFSRDVDAIARAKGFLMVSSSPLTRSSHHAGDDFARLKAAREAQLRR